MTRHKTQYEVIFTSNTTEAINIAADNLRRVSETDSKQVVLNTLLEHSSNDLPWRMISDSSVVRLSINPDGFIDLHELENLLISYNRENNRENQRIRLVAVSGASNVLGACNDLEED